VKHAAFASFVRAIGAVHATVGAALVTRRERVPLAAVVVAGCAVYWFGKRHEAFPWREFVLRAYVLPVAFPALLHLWLIDARTWEAAAEALRGYVVGVVAGTPASVYLAVLAFSCLTAAGRRARPF
jgi:hypothetical protein